MGMYTELNLAVRLNEDVPAAVVETLQTMFAGNGANVAQSEHALFHTDRWTWMLASGGSYYFPTGPDATHRTMKYDSISKAWFLSFRTSIKNYDDEWELFLDWLGPYAEDGTGTYQYEEDELPTLVVHRGGKFELISVAESARGR